MRMTRPTKVLAQWPAYYYSLDGEARIFNKAEDVPLNWFRTPPETHKEGEPREGVLLDREYYVKALEDKGIEIDPRWPIVHMKHLVG